jgi:hypothetical protein
VAEPQPGAFGLFALALTIIALVWARARSSAFALFFEGMPTLKSFVDQVVPIGTVTSVTTLRSALFAAIVFAVASSRCDDADRSTGTVVR